MAIWSSFLAAASLVIYLSPALVVDAAKSRPHLNFAPAPAVPKVQTPDNAPVKNGIQLPPYNTWYYFDQLIDHNNPSLGTFQQRYYFTYEYYEPGGPIVISTPGEGNAEGYQGYLTNRTVNGLIANSNHGAAVVIEHRFFGLSNPYPDLSEESFRVHTIEQAVEDLVYFAKTAHLPMPGGDQVGADKAPWILVGGSYSGALTSWVMQSRPGVFWAGYSSSGVSQAIEYYWGYFEPIRQSMPKNCSADVERVVAHFDLTGVFGSKKAKLDLATKFGMQNVTHFDDVSGALRNPIWSWQSLSPSTGPGGAFFKFCDALEVKDGVSAGPNGWGLEQALDAWGKYSTEWVAENCDSSQSVDACLGTYDTSLDYWHDTSVDNAWRSWEWFLCAEFGYWQDGAPLGWPSLVSRLITPSYDNRQCNYFFPKTFPSERSANPKDVQFNQKYGGWNINIDRLFIANGKQDPWKEATLSSDFHPRKSTDRQPIVVSNGFHCSDLGVRNSVDPTIKQVQDLAVSYFGKWMQEYYAAHPNTPNPNANSTTPAPPSTIPQGPTSTIPDSIIGARPSAVPGNVTEPMTPPQTGAIPPNAKHLVPNAWGVKIPTVKYT
jgi:hypothetical protein